MPMDKTNSPITNQSLGYFIVFHFGIRLLLTVIVFTNLAAAANHPVIKSTTCISNTLKQLMNL